MCGICKVFFTVLTIWIKFAGGIAEQDTNDRCDTESVLVKPQAIASPSSAPQRPLFKPIAVEEVMAMENLMYLEAQKQQKKQKATYPCPE